MRTFLSILVVALSVIVTLACFDYALHFTPYGSLIQRYVFPPDYFDIVPGLGHDIRPDQPPSLMTSLDYQFYAWSNEIGCFDTSIYDIKPDTPFIYVTGDSFTWAYTPFQYKWGTIIQNEIGMRVLKCGVPGYGTKAELEKTEYDLKNFASAPKLIIVGYYGNDPIDDSATSTTSDFPVCEIGTMPFRCWLSQNWFAQHSVIYNAAYDVLSKYVSPYVQPTPQMFENNFANLSAFESYARSRDSKLLVVLIPPGSATYNDQTVYSEVSAYLASQHIAYVDLTPLLHAYHHPGVSLYLKSNSHLNILGNELTGYILSQYLIENNYISVPNKNAALQNIQNELQQLVATTSPTSQ